MEIHYNVGSIFAFYASFTAFLSLAKQFYHQFIPKQIRDYIDDKIKVWFSKKTILDPKIFTLVIRQTFEEHSYTHINSVYSACEVYLTDKLTASSARLEGCRKDKQEGDLVSYHLVQGEEYVEYVELDNENNNTKSVKLQWKSSCRNDKDEEIKGGRYKLFELSFDPRYKELILGKFIPSVVVKNYNKFMEAKKEIFLYTYNGVMSSSRQWNKVSFKHPFTFDALALDPELKKSIVEDLDRFVRRREFYKKIGRAWKRGYLLYGPPGTGKSSLIAAIANYLKFSVYDLQLASIEKDSTLRNLMMSISNKSILVIEDIDCASGLSRKVALSRNNNVARPRNVACLGDGGDYGYRDSSDDSDYGSENYGVYGSIGYEYYDEDEDNYGDDKANNNGGTEAAADSQNKIELTLSGLLNFIDGLWSSCGDERIIILTTNYKERLDPALLRPGRMDLHIHMSYLRMSAFRTLAYNYLGLSDHPLFKEIEVLLERTDVSPAEAAEELIRSEDPDIALDGLVKMMKKKKRFVKMETKGKEDNVGGESVAEKEKSGSESTSHTEITEEC